MIQQKPDRFAAWYDDRPYIEIREDKGYYEGFWAWKNSLRPTQNNVVNIKEAAHG
jgi:hypothetical protein